MRNDANSPALDAVLARLNTDPKKLDEMQGACMSIKGAKETAAWLRQHDAALAAEMTTDALAGLLLHAAKTRVGVFANVLGFAG